jgi:hypothetical protein
VSYRDDIWLVRERLRATNDGSPGAKVAELALERLASGNAALWADIIESGRYDVRVTRREEPRQPLPYISAGYGPTPQQLETPNE